MAGPNPKYLLARVVACSSYSPHEYCIRQPEASIRVSENFSAPPDSSVALLHHLRRKS